MEITTTKPVIQRILTLDNANFSEVNNIEKLGGAEGAYVIEEGSRKVVIKIVVKVDDKDMIDSTVMSYNLAKDFGVKIPSARYLKLDTEEGRVLIAKAKLFPALDLASKLEAANAITLYEHIPGETLRHFENKGLEDEEVKEIRGNLNNFVDLGKMLVFDAAIFNIDRFKVELGDTLANPGNLMIANNQMVGLDQDFARFDNYFSPGENLSGYEATYSNFKALLSDPEILAQTLVEKMVTEGYVLFEGMNEHIAVGIREGIKTLKELADKDNPRVEELIEWSKTFNPDTDLETEKVKEYWNWLIG